jgi:predicted nucleotidyltransferase
MSVVEPLPGSAQHQALLRRIVDTYAQDERVLAVSVFGSLARETWDGLSDIDLDIIVRTEVDELAEGRRLGGPDALVVPTRGGEIDVVLGSLEEFSIRFHTLGTTNAHIVADLTVLSGQVDRAAIVAAGVVHSVAPRPLEVIVSDALRQAIGVDIGVGRRRLWMALRLLDDLRTRMMELFATARSLPRVTHGFDAHASIKLQRRMYLTVARPDLADVRRALGAALDVLEHDLAELSDGRYELNQAQRGVLGALRQRMAES